MLETVEKWQTLFENWPDAIKRQGSIISKQGEAVPFVNFLIADGLLLVERNGPDVSGARKVVISFSEIAMIKLAAAGELTQFQAMGFQASI